MPILLMDKVYARMRAHRYFVYPARLQFLQTHLIRHVACTLHDCTVAISPGCPYTHHRHLRCLVYSLEMSNMVYCRAI